MSTMPSTSPNTDGGQGGAKAYDMMGVQPQAGSGLITVINRPDMPLLGCKNLQCQQQKCTNAASTSIAGRVYDPAGQNPLYNVAVFVPNEELKPMLHGASCEPCNSLYPKVVVSTLTDAAGNFVLQDVPVGTDIPLVIQIGKWRRQFKVPNVAACVTTSMPDKTLRMPRNHLEGDMPNIAISTGSADTLECLLRRVGVDASEYTPGATGEGRVHIFQGNPGRGNRRDDVVEPPNTAPAAPRSTEALWNSTASLMNYDVVLLSCEGQETPMMNQQALHDYASAGGRVFASHFHYSWFNTGPYGSENLATWVPGSNSIGDIDAVIDTSFPKGQALATWLETNGALRNGLLPIQEARHNADVGPSHAASQVWISASQSSDAPGATQYFSFNTPTDRTGPDSMPCGRVVFSDLHVGAASEDDTDQPVPGSCSNVALSPQEKALEFMLFDLSACVIPDDRPPVPPPPLG